MKCASWIQATKRKGFTPSASAFSHLCSDHFAEDAYDQTKQSGFCKRRFLKSDAVPTIFNFPQHLQPKKLKCRKPPATRTLNEPLGDMDQNARPNIMNDDPPNPAPIVPQTRKLLHVSDCVYHETDNTLDLRRKLSFVLNAYRLLKKQIKGLQQHKRRLRKRHASLVDIVKDLKDKQLISEQATMALQNLNPDVRDLFQRQLGLDGKKKSKYSPSLRIFALTLHFYSAKAYDYVRKTFSTCLPHPNTLRRWYTSVNGEPGFTEESFKMLTVKAKQDTPILCSLMMDEMSIRKQIDWDGNRSYGFIDCGTGLSDESLGIAREAFVLLLVAINGHWKLPVAYFLTDGLDSKEKANIIVNCLVKVHATGVQVVSLTFDGAAANLSMTKILGADFSDVNNFKTCFPHPTTSAPVYVLLDACHMLKLVRNCFGEKRIFKDCNDSIINFSFIDRLYELQSKEGLHAANKLKKQHMEWRRQKMKVKLAAQMLSESVAEGIEFCAKKLNLDEFQGSDATVTFIKIIDKCFDILNSRNFLGKKSKSPISAKSFDTTEQFVNLACLYIANLKDKDGKPLHQTNRRTGFIGFLFNLRSIVELSRQLVLGPQPKLKFLLTYKLSQDHLEMFFSAVRSQGGHNNNPSARQFISTYRRLLVHHSLQNMKTGNCLAQDSTGILTTSSGTGPVIDYLEYRQTDAQQQSGDEHEVDSNVVLIMEPGRLSEFSEEVVKYIGGFVCRKVRRSVKCLICTEALVDQQSNCLLVDQKTHGGLLRPSLDVITICSISEKFIRQQLSTKPEELQQFMQSIPALKLAIRRNLIDKALFQQLETHIQDLPVENNHLILLINQIISAYIDVRAHHIATTETARIQGPRVRNNLTKLILFKNQ